MHFNFSISQYQVMACICDPGESCRLEVEGILKVPVCVVEGTALIPMYL